MTREIVKFPVFLDRRGNRFVFPGLYSGGNGFVATEVWSRSRQIEVALGVTEEKGTFDVPIDDDGRLTFPHVPADAGSSGFAHGSSKVWIIGGPEFDASSMEMANA